MDDRGRRPKPPAVQTRDWIPSQSKTVTRIYTVMASKYQVKRPKTTKEKLTPEINGGGAQAGIGWKKRTSQIWTREKSNHRPAPRPLNSLAFTLPLPFPSSPSSSFSTLFYLSLSLWSSAHRPSHIPGHLQVELALGPVTCVSFSALLFFLLPFSSPLTKPPPLRH